MNESPDFSIAPGIEMNNRSGSVWKRGIFLGHISCVEDREVRKAWQAWLSR